MKPGRVRGVDRETLRVIDTNKTMIADRLDEHIPGFPSIGWKKWLRAPHRDVMRLRSLLVRKRATTSDPVLAFVFRLGDNGVFWKLLGFWPGRVLPPGVRY
jgi:hypothetical protein